MAYKMLVYYYYLFYFTEFESVNGYITYSCYY